MRKYPYRFYNSYKYKYLYTKNKQKRTKKLFILFYFTVLSKFVRGIIQILS